jgi:NADP-dependent 3-hydroxy acid dehydrogenase YdfG
MSPLVWLITGCSAGIGEQFVHGIVARGDKVIATARNLDSIKHLENSSVAIFQLDVTDNESNIRDKIKVVATKYGKIDILVNNAGYIQIGMVEDLRYDTPITS